MNQAPDPLSDGDFNPQFLPQLPSETVLEGFVRLPFSAWEFPKPPQVRIRISLRDQQLALPEHQPGRYFNGKLQ